MVERFLCWRLPKDFTPDCGVSFKPPARPYEEAAWWPVGTNLLTAVQAKEMFETILEGVDLDRPEGIHVSYSLDKLRQLASKVRKEKGGEFSTEQVKAFLSLFGEDLEDRLNQTVREFLQEKLG